MSENIIIRKVEKGDISVVVDIITKGWQTVYQGMFPKDFLDNLEAKIWPSALVNKGRVKRLTSERLEEINAVANVKHIINTYAEEIHPNTCIEDDIVRGNITIDVYGNVVSYGLSFEEEDKEAYDTGLNILEMSASEAIKLFVEKHTKERIDSYKKLGLEYK